MTALTMMDASGLVKLCADRLDEFRLFSIIVSDLCRCDFLYMYIIVRNERVWYSFVSVAEASPIRG